MSVLIVPMHRRSIGRAVRQYRQIRFKPYEVRYPAFLTSQKSQESRRRDVTKVRGMHSDARQKSYHEGNNSIANLHGADRPMSPIKAKGRSTQYYDLRRRVGLAKTGEEVLDVVFFERGVEDSMVRDPPTLAAAAKRLGELHALDTLLSFLSLLRSSPLAVPPMNATLVASILTALTRCISGDNPTRRDQVFHEAVLWWNLLIDKTAPAYGAALSLCARVLKRGEIPAGVAKIALDWAKGLYREIESEANVIHLSCFLRVLASQGEWEKVTQLWGDVNGPTPNAACLAGLLVEAESLERVEGLWRDHSEAVAVPAAPTLYSLAMQRFLHFGSPEGVLRVEEARCAAGASDFVVDRFGNVRTLLALWHYRVNAHLLLAEEEDRSAEERLMHRAEAVRHAAEALEVHVCHSTPEKHLTFFRQVVAEHGGIR